VVAGLGITAFASGLSGFLMARLNWGSRALLFIAAALMLYPGDSVLFPEAWLLTIHDLGGAILLGAVAVTTRLAKRAAKL